MMRHKLSPQLDEDTWRLFRAGAAVQGCTTSQLAAALCEDWVTRNRDKLAQLAGALPTPGQLQLGDAPVATTPAKSAQVRTQSRQHASPRSRQRAARAKEGFTAGRRTRK